MKPLSLLLALLLVSSAIAYPRKLAALVPELSVLTSFAHDYGDSVASVHFRGTAYEPAEASEKILPLLEWTKRSDREALGAAWVEEICLQGWEIVTPERPGSEGVAGPTSEILSDGTFRYTATAISMRGRSPGSDWARWQFDITPEGKITSTALAKSEDQPWRR